MNINWKFIVQLSMPGLVMAFATISLVSSSAEPFVWILIFLWAGYMVAKNTGGKHFLYGFFVSILNSVWVTGVHIAFAGVYLDHHPQEAAMMSAISASGSPWFTMLTTGMMIGGVSGIILGFVALIAGKILRGESNTP